jgi:hypothetical protein
MVLNYWDLFAVADRRNDLFFEKKFLPPKNMIRLTLPLFCIIQLSAAELYAANDAS